MIYGIVFSFILYPHILVYGKVFAFEGSIQILNLECIGRFIGYEQTSRSVPWLQTTKVYALKRATLRRLLLNFQHFYKLNIY